MQLECRGFFPKGGGALELRVQPLLQGSSLQAIQMTQRGALKSITITAFTAGNLKPSIAERMAKAAHAVLEKAGVKF